MGKTDVILFGTPLYWYGPLAKMKLFQDHLRPFIGSKKLKGKRDALLFPREKTWMCATHFGHV
ncbi:MAG: NAD(P)H-dependent oxidoreductase [Crenarchaeota archaeon]|nr:NAD(P)H-dependent oxidoreductase [Thermoproteota archaeon]